MLVSMALPTRYQIREYQQGHLHDDRHGSLFERRGILMAVPWDSPSLYLSPDFAVWHAACHPMRLIESTFSSGNYKGHAHDNSDFSFPCWLHEIKQHLCRLGRSNVSVLQ
ncbi:hypothetical protein H112_05745 [Trichophyton rubrum D6]|uniref:Uncharacterized protein n=3 Tax=Trichophyton TaxID=5550 RepID=F2SKA7_TRIRC|nr:uncharacterized protein TERG_03460 [Trichophyton rubrum CBS 118892]EZF16302.1 hypothetical protein H100_05762 [Trichophyton rubrum MR850]EZF40438.1 hypothetical protein H102_05730 [Trichophyton rubrum CBS 100081]EZF50946.1 hypothetical protein H103_05758 [Trichophyton rubrum CBS 288.86]EZF61661.1 hypothetical protein H104_05742 [Trichophyton rubrum CBS 289.86]EZF72050.1 hypothetical protein H105_05771 [Trichophyton soudanense CBS 452.61]EZF82772.1 hypothetical protein H110_05751 [Trichophy